MKIRVFVVTIGLPVLLVLGAVYDLLSPREWAIGMIAWVAVLLLWASARKRPAKNHHAPGGGEPRAAADGDARKRLLLDIRKWKIWIGVLIVLLAIGIASGVAHRAWLPTSTGVAISLLLMYLGIREIKQLRQRVGLSRDN